VSLLKENIQYQNPDDQVQDPQFGEDYESKSDRSGTLSDYLFLFSISGFIVLLDQLTKIAVRTRLDFSETWAPWDWLLPIARIVHWRNTGAAFGIFQSFGMIFTILAIVVSIAIIYYFPRVPKDDWTFRYALALQLGGALGNLLDRLVVGEVTDFISVGRFPVFNIADASIFIGVLLLLYGMWQKDRRPQAEDDSSRLQASE
jgi:signal peptidase II